LTAIDIISKEFFPVKGAYPLEVFYMRYHLFIGGESAVCEFHMRLDCMNNYLLYCPTIEQNDNKFNQCQVLGDHQLCNIVNLAENLNGLSAKMMEANVDPYNLGLHNLLECLEKL
jgi:hypothetical protein